MPEPTVQLNVRVTAEQAEKVRRLAEKDERTATWVIRSLIDRAEER